jgi:hypothetical protein
MLFTDGNFITPALLDSIDGEFSLVAAAQEIDALAFIAEAVNSAGAEFIGDIQNFSGYLYGVAVGGNHQMAVMNILTGAINRPRALLNQIPVTEPNPTRTAFRRWVQFFVLYEFYTAMSWRTTTDRYSIKAEHYEKQKRRAWENLKGNGFPIVISPLPCPGALLEYNPGTWAAGNVTAVAGGASVALAAYDVAITYCSLPSYVSPANQGNAESAGAVTQTVAVPAAHVVSVSIVGLNPPSGTFNPAIGTAQGIYSPMPATHWNVYVGLPGGVLYLQNGSPIPVAATSYTLAGPPVLSGSPINAGQSSNWDFSFQNILWRA